ncbi:hypothetical protein M011DRAFT_221821 [Sporormia fimetaria CBS 119925]|uniref:Uncharacterized protein n=1 Tax=Sporormia fimetaria CBS 119925 TaxID=1340428 RepID=A0A6A6UYV5_9PLEO|nr:hypothetical protein M011DRAFT_221821 [Sporormia fimetaria CBS 119925]
MHIISTILLSALHRQYPLHHFLTVLSCLTSAIPSHASFSYSRFLSSEQSPVPAPYAVGAGKPAVHDLRHTTFHGSSLSLIRFILSCTDFTLSVFHPIRLFTTTDTLRTPARLADPVTSVPRHIQSDSQYPTTRAREPTSHSSATTDELSITPETSNPPFDSPLSPPRVESRLS